MDEDLHETETYQEWMRRKKAKYERQRIMNAINITLILE